MAAITDATYLSPEEVRSSLSHFVRVEGNEIISERCSGGVNNKVYKVTVAGNSYILRVYNNGFNEARVVYEHEILRQLAKVAHTFEFKIPEPLPLLGDSAKTIAHLADGGHACVFKVIPGNLAKLESAFHIGKATAVIVKAMESLHIDLPLPNPLYRNLFDAHTATAKDRNVFFNAVAGPEFDAVREPMNALIKDIETEEKVIEEILTKNVNLPEQQIHADLHFLNVLCNPENHIVTGVLDFEFSARDWRVMEAAVGLSKYVGLKDIEPVFVEWIDGYKQGGGVLTETECDYLPDLIIIRVLSNVIYFVGRGVAKEDTFESITSRAAMYRDRLIWIRERADWMRNVAKERLCK